MTMSVWKGPCSILHFSDNDTKLPQPYRIASYCNYSLCVSVFAFVEFVLFLSTGWNCHYYSIRFGLGCFVLSFDFSLSSRQWIGLQFHYVELALRKSRNKSMRSYDRKQQCLFVFLLLTNETKSHLSNILKNLQTPRFVVLLLLLLLFSFDMHFFRFYYFRCMSINTHIAISYCNNRIFMHLFCDFKSMILA